MWNKFTELAHRAILLAQNESTQRGSRAVSVPQLVLGVLRCEDNEFFEMEQGAPGGVVTQLLSRNQVEVARLSAQLAALPLQSLSEKQRATSDEPQLTRDGKRVLELASDEARRLHCNYIGPEHLLLGVLCFPNTAQFLLHEHDLDAEKLRAQIRHLAGPDEPRLQPGEIALSESVRDLLTQSQQQASLSGNGRVGTGHLLLALILNGEARPNDEVIRMVQTGGVSLSEMRERIKVRLVSDREVSGTRPKPTNTLRRVLEKAKTEASRTSERLVKEEHLLLALSQQPSRHWQLLLETWKGDSQDSVAFDVLALQGLDKATLRNQLLS
jgi:ATP-dependent Clp protease ATP-binding subunit ClpA